MKTSDLKYVKEWYSEYRSLLFNNDIPDVEDVDFKLHSLTYAAGYSAYIEHPKTKSGNNHVIAFCKLFVFSEKEIKEILIHEMIHLWQDSHVKHERYKICSNDIAHDRVFRTKMNTINLLLKRYMIDLHITEVCDYNIRIDERVKSSKTYNIILFKFNGAPNIIKCTQKYVGNIKTELLNNTHVSDMFSLVSNDIIFSLFKTTKSSARFQNKCPLKEYTNEMIYDKYRHYGKQEK